MAEVMPNMTDGIAFVVHNVLHEFCHIFVGGSWNNHCSRC